MKRHPDRPLASAATTRRIRARPTFGLAVPVVLLLAAAGCGVQEHPQGGTSNTPTYNWDDPGNPGSSGSAATSGAGGSGVASGAGGFSGSSGALSDGSGGSSGSSGSSVNGSGGSGNSSGSGGSGSPGSSGGSTAHSGGSSGVSGSSGSSGSAQGVGGGPAGLGGSSGSAGSPGLGGSSGVTVNIGGTSVPQEKIVAFIHFGHSNMAGRADAPQDLRSYFFKDADPHGWLFKDKFQPALEPNTAGDDGNNQPLVAGQTLPLGGPGTALIKQAIAMAPSYYFVSLGYGKGASYCSQFLPNHLYYDNVMKQPRAVKGHVTFGAIFVMLGITERHGTSADITGFPDCINTLATKIRSELDAPDLPLLLSDYEMSSVGTLAATTDFAQQIIPEIHRVPDVVKNSAIVPTDDLPLADGSASDGHHFNLEGQKTWAARALQVMKDKGWFPWQ